MHTKVFDWIELDPIVKCEMLFIPFNPCPNNIEHTITDIQKSNNGPPVFEHVFYVFSVT